MTERGKTHLDVRDVRHANLAYVSTLTWLTITYVTRQESEQGVIALVTDRSRGSAPGRSSCASHHTSDELRLTRLFL